MQGRPTRAAPFSHSPPQVVSSSFLPTSLLREGTPVERGACSGPAYSDEMTSKPLNAPVAHRGSAHPPVPCAS
jgi:hypothetical protein